YLHKLCNPLDTLRQDHLVGMGDSEENDRHMIETATGTPARALRIGDLAPDFIARSTRGQVRLSSYRGRRLVFFSHPADFTPVCTTEFIGLSRHQAEFDALDCALVGLSVDSLYAHLAWVKAIEQQFGVTIEFPIIEDPSMAIGIAYGMIDGDSADATAMRSVYFIDPDGIIRAIISYP